MFQKPPNLWRAFFAQELLRDRNVPSFLKTRCLEAILDRVCQTSSCLDCQSLELLLRFAVPGVYQYIDSCSESGLLTCFYPSGFPCSYYLFCRPLFDIFIFRSFNEMIYAIIA